ncbi:MAG: hypothetical protein L7S67_11185 [Flavobacteriales bacterium]|nr:hypothetical protein [Flavobacteriales bacterium]
MALGFCSCGGSPSERPIEASEGPDLIGVEFAEFFGFSRGRDTLWLQDGEGVWTPWTYRTGANTSHEKQGQGSPTMDLPNAPKIATWSTTHVPHIQALNVSEQWVGTGYKSRVNISEGGESGLPLHLGGDGGLDEEALVASGAHVLTSYPFGDPMQGVGERTGVKVMPLREYEEQHPLARAEYIKVFGWLLGQSTQADATFNGIAQRYAEAQAKGQRLATSDGSPVVFTGSEQGGLWTAPTFDGLVARLVEDAGGQYLLDQKTEQSMGLRRVGSNIEMELEQFAVLAADADAWGKVVYAPDGWYQEDAKAALSWLNVEGKLLFHCNTAEVDYFGQAVLEPDVMLADLVALLHDQTAEDGAPGTALEPRYFHRTTSRP